MGASPTARAEPENRFAGRAPVPALNSRDGHAPPYGGYCAYAFAQGKVVDVDPRQWKIVDRKLYQNAKDPNGHIRKADKNWPLIPREEL